MNSSPGYRAAPGLYIHVPFCARVCPYCDFAVQTGGPRRRRSFVDSLLREIEIWSELMPGQASPADRDLARSVDTEREQAIAWRGTSAFDTVYLGGGTPSSLAAEMLEEILDAVRRSLPIAPEAGIAMETNPEDVTVESVAAWRALGITTLSLGIQSFDPAALAFLGRSHSSAAAVAALEMARGTPFSTVSLDLIFALPGQSSERWRANLEAAVKLRPDHISCYELTIHQGTRFARQRERGDLVEVAEDDRAELFFLTHELLADHGYEAYEVSNFARGPEYRSAHNRKYWDHTAYLGLGPSSHSFDGFATRWWNTRRLPAWQAGLEAVRESIVTGKRQHLPVDAGSTPVAGFETLSRAALVLEALALGLRTTAGVDLLLVRELYGIDVMGENAELVETLRQDGFLFDTGSPTRLVPTLRGLAVADALAGSFSISDR